MYSAKGKMAYADMKEYLNYISTLPVTIDQDERFYKLKSYIQRYEYSQQSKQIEKDRLNDLMKESCIMLHFMKNKGLQVNSNYDTGISYTKYILNGITIESYITSAGIAIEKYHTMVKNMLSNHFVSYLNEYSNFTLYLYNGSATHLSELQTIDSFVYNENKTDATIYAFESPLNDSQLEYYSLLPAHDTQYTAIQTA
jgi:hypothetical protein